MKKTNNNGSGRAFFLIICVCLIFWWVYDLVYVESGEFAWGFVSLIFIGWVVVIHLIAEAAETKKQNYILFFVLGIIISPILTGIIVALMGNQNKKKIRQR